jgi:hypothetical protein
MKQEQTIEQLQERIKELEYQLSVSWKPCSLIPPTEDDLITMSDGSKNLWVILHVDSGFIELEKLVGRWKGAHWRK